MSRILGLTHRMDLYIVLLFKIQTHPYLFFTAGIKS